MAPLTPRPVAPDVPLAAVAVRMLAAGRTGLWLRGQRRPTPVIVARGRQRLALWVAGDLGWLLRYCSVVVVQEASKVVAVQADDLIRMRVLRIVAGLPYLPTLETLETLFPGALRGTDSFAVPLRHRTAEEVLAACARARIPIARSRVVYDRRFREYADS